MMNNTEITAANNKLMIRSAEKFLTENYLTSLFTLHCAEMRINGAKEKWDHQKRWEAVSEWIRDVAGPTIKDEAKLKGVTADLTAWYEEFYLKTVPASRNNNWKKKGESKGADDSFMNVDNNPFA
ncbi:MAG: hypothetical protein UIM53_02975 [Acutalibacteraceae bacterium]|nr:hypothetical protein [Acutalibacteraceae bacterium]